MAVPAWAVSLRRNAPDTIRELYVRHFPAVRGFVLQNNGSISDAQDVFQEAMAALWLRVKEGRLQNEQDPGGFLYRVARNKWLDVLRSAARKNMRVVQHERIMDPTDEPDEGVEERLARLRDVYDKLDDKCRKVLDQVYFERKDLATIAAGMGVAEESIRTIKYRCMMKLRAFRNAIRGEEQEQG